MTTANATIIISDVHLKTGLEQEVPGAPTSLSPLVLSQALDPSEIAMTSDTARVLVGHSPISGDINYKRSVFPYQNIEILTETSPRTREIFNDFMKAQTKDTFYLPTVVDPSSDGFVDITYSNYSGNTIPSKLYGSNSSVTIEYHIFDNTSNVAIKQGTLHCLLNPTQHTLYDDYVESVTPSFEFNVNQSYVTDAYGRYYQLQGQNYTESSVKLYIRKVTVVAISA